MRASISFGAVVLDAQGLRGQLNATFTNFTLPESLNGWPFKIAFEVRAETATGTTLHTEDFVGLAKPSDAQFHFPISVATLPTASKYVLVGIPLDGVYGTSIGDTKTSTVSPSTGVGGKADITKWILLAAGFVLVVGGLGKKIKWLK